MKRLIGLVTVVFFGCTSQMTAPGTNSVADAYFFPQSNGLEYTYSQYVTATPDTTTYEVIVNAQYNSFTRLQKSVGGVIQPDILYYYKTSFDRDGVLECLMAHDAAGTNSLVALKGSLDVGSTWYADNAETIQAEVTARYENFVIPGHDQQYFDVVVVKYTDKNAAPDTYILRYFAREYGLIMERTIIGSQTEISNLHLLKRERTSGKNMTLPGRPDRWYDVNGRYSIQPALDPNSENN
jgi:hypothetical protein